MNSLFITHRMKPYLSSSRHERYSDDPALMRCLVGEPTIGPSETWVQQTQLYHITRVLHSTHLSAFGIVCTFRICSCPFQVSPPGKSRDPMMFSFNHSSLREGFNMRRHGAPCDHSTLQTPGQQADSGGQGRHTSAPET